MKYFNPYEDIRITRNHLPHWQQTGRTYFITYRLADAVPAALLKKWDEERIIWRSFHPEPLSAAEEEEYHRRFSSQLDRWLDAGHGSCLLREPAMREVVKESLGHFEGQRHHAFSWVIMPNHVHILATLHAEWSLEKVIATWKRRTAVALNRLRGATGQVWQEDYFDRLIRDGGHFDNVIRYIRRNPAKAKLREGEYGQYECEDARRVL